MNQEEGQRIEQWGVIGDGRLTGAVFNRPGHRDGGRIVTSPVVEIRLMGAGTWAHVHPIAFTESGNAYRLGQPSARFGVDAAEQFIHAKLSSQAAPKQRDQVRRAFDPGDTIVRAALDTSLQNFDSIEVYETSFKPL